MSADSGWPTFSIPPRVAFLDVDGTLLPATTSFLMAQRLRRLGLLSRGFLLRSVYHGLQHRFGRLQYRRLVGYAIEQLGSIPLVELERQAYETFKEDVKPRLYRGVVDHLDGLRASGTDLVLVSASPGFVIKPLALYLQCVDVLSTPVRVEGERIVGIGDGPACYGDGKRELALEWAARHGIDMDQAVAYADNWSDRTLLQTSGHAVVVRPRGALKRLALEEGWDIVEPDPTPVRVEV